jgi:hypothetical protein
MQILWNHEVAGYDAMSGFFRLHFYCSERRGINVQRVLRVE